MMPVIKTHALPMITSGAKTFGKEALRSAANIATDSLSDINFMDSLKNRSKEGINSLHKKMEDQRSDWKRYKKEEKEEYISQL